jgi:hypothetical protein
MLSACCIFFNFASEQSGLLTTIEKQAKNTNKRIHCSTATFVCFGRLWNWFIYIHTSIKYIIYVGNGVSQILHKSTLEPDNVDKF